jgi:iron complex transport system substrate-binding protein
VPAAVSPEKDYFYCHFEVRGKAIIKRMSQKTCQQFFTLRTSGIKFCERIKRFLHFPSKTIEMNLIRFRLLLVFVVLALGGNAQQVQRIISLTPSLTENIYLIEANDRLVGCTSYCTRAVKDGVQQVGSTVNVNIEKVLSLKPDLVLTMKLTKEQDVAAMRKLGIRVEVLETPVSFEGICEQTLKIAQLVESESTASDLIANAKTKVEEIRTKCSRLEKQKVFFQIGASPIFTVLDNTFMDDYMRICNAENIAAGMNKGTMTRESVLVKNPDVVIIATMGGFGEQEKNVWNSYEGMSAVKRNKVFLISSETSCSPTPANFVSALEDVYNFVSQ